MKLKNKAVIIAMTALAILGAGSAGAIAYLTDSEQHTNVITVGDIKTELEEPNWVPSQAEKMVPYQTVAKDPQIENTGDNDEIVFMKVTVPVVSVTEVTEAGVKGTKQSQEIVFMQKSGTLPGVHANAFNTDASVNGTWVELSSRETNADYSAVDLNGSGTRTYVFAYNKKLAPEGKTSALFNQIQLKNVVENELTANAGYNIKVEAYAIQADNIMQSGTPISTTGTISNADLLYIYDAFVNQAAGATAREATGGEKDLAGDDNS